MRFFICFLLACWSLQTLGQAIVRGEYYIDEDPGVGKGVPVTFNSPADYVDQVFEFNTDDLLPGPHTLVVRIQDSNGKWSIGKYARFFIEGSHSPPAPSKIAAAEFFVDVDPGPGKAISVNGISEADSINSPTQYTVNALSSGLHRLGVRVKDATGQWSLTKYYRFMVESYLPEVPDTSNIVALEYFLDSNDPGIGNATPLSITSPDQTVLIIDSLDLVNEGLQLGRHQFLVRIRDSKGRWSLTNVQPFDYCSPTGVTAGFDYELNGNEITFTDLSSYAVDYRWQMGNGDVLLDSVPEYTYAQGGTYEVCQIVWNRCDRDTICKTIMVTTPRIADSIPDINILEDSPETIVIADLNTVFEDLDGDPLTFSVKSDTSLIPATLIDGKTFTIAATDDYVRTIGVNVTATGGGSSVTQRVKVTVLPINDTPYIAKEINDVAYDEDSGPRVVVHNLEDYIKDDDDKRYRRFDREAWRWRQTRLNFTAISNEPSIQPEIVNNDSLVLHLGQDYHGQSEVTLIATDDSLVSAEHTFQVNVIPLEDAPRLIAPIPDVTTQEDFGELIIGSVVDFFIEPDGQQLNLKPQTNNPAVQLFISGNDISITSDENFHGSVTGIITADDAFQSVADTFEITILPVNDPPKFTGLNDFGICPETVFTLSLTDKYSDAESNTSTLTLGAKVLSSSNPTVNSNTLQIEWDGDSLMLKSSMIVPTVYALLITATDPQQNTGTDTLLVSLYGANIEINNDTLIANLGSSYQWYINGKTINGATNQTYIGKGAGLYQVEVGNGTCKTLSNGVNVTSLADSELLANTIVYPNPSNGSFYCQLRTSYQGVVQLSVLDLLGRHLLQKNVAKTNQTLTIPFNIQPLPQGVYLLELKTAQGHIIKRLFKE